MLKQDSSAMFIYCLPAFAVLTGVVTTIDSFTLYHEPRMLSEAKHNAHKQEQQSNPSHPDTELYKT